MGSASAWFVVGFGTCLFLTSALVFTTVVLGEREMRDEDKDAE